MQQRPLTERLKSFIDGERAVDINDSFPGGAGEGE